MGHRGGGEQKLLFGLHCTCMERNGVGWHGDNQELQEINQIINHTLNAHVPIAGQVLLLEDAHDFRVACVTHSVIHHTCVRRHLYFSAHGRVQDLDADPGPRHGT